MPWRWYPGMTQIWVMWATRGATSEVRIDSGQLVTVRRAQHEGGLRLELAAAGQQDDVLQEFQRAGFAAVLVVDLAVGVIGVGQLDQTRAGGEVAVVPALQAQAGDGGRPEAAGSRAAAAARRRRADANPAA